MKLFLDANVIISALLSQKGAAYILCGLGNSKHISLYTSENCVQEIMTFQTRKKKNYNVKEFISNCGILLLSIENENIEQYKKYVCDLYDAHVVCGAISENVDILVTFNIKDFKKDLIRTDHKITTYTQGEVLQLFRQLNLYA